MPEAVPQNHDEQLHNQQAMEAVAAVLEHDHSYEPGHVCGVECDHHHAESHIDHLDEHLTHKEQHSHEVAHEHGPGCGHVGYDNVHEHIDKPHVHTEHCGHLHHDEARVHIDHPQEKATTEHRHDHEHIHGPGCGHVHHEKAHEHVDHTRANNYNVHEQAAETVNIHKKDLQVEPTQEYVREDNKLDQEHAYRAEQHIKAAELLHQRELRSQDETVRAIIIETEQHTVLDDAIVRTSNTPIITEKSALNYKAELESTMDAGEHERQIILEDVIADEILDVSHLVETPPDPTSESSTVAETEIDLAVLESPLESPEESSTSTPENIIRLASSELVPLMDEALEVEVAEELDEPSVTLATEFQNITTEQDAFVSAPTELTNNHLVFNNEVEITHSKDVQVNETQSIPPSLGVAIPTTERLEEVMTMLTKAEEPDFNVAMHEQLLEIGQYLLPTQRLELLTAIQEKDVLALRGMFERLLEQSHAGLYLENNSFKLFRQSTTDNSNISLIGRLVLGLLKRSPHYTPMSFARQSTASL